MFNKFPEIFRNFRKFPEISGIWELYRDPESPLEPLKAPHKNPEIANKAVRGSLAGAHVG